MFLMFDDYFIFEIFKPETRFINILIDENCQIMYNEYIDRTIDFGGQEMKVQLISEEHR